MMTVEITKINLTRRFYNIVISIKSDPKENIIISYRKTNERYIENRMLVHRLGLNL